MGKINKPMIKTFYDVVFLCACGCGTQLSVSKVTKEGETTFTIKEPDDIFRELLVSKEDIKKIIELLK